MAVAEQRSVVGSGVDFDSWYRNTEPLVRRALVAALGVERGREAAAEAMAWAWQHRDRAQALDRPVGYLYKVGQTRSRRRLARLLPTRTVWSDPWVEPELSAALAGLSERQRVVVVLVHCYDWTLSEVADLLDIRKTTVQNHLERGLAGLRAHLKAVSDE